MGAEIIRKMEETTEDQLAIRDQILSITDLKDQEAEIADRHQDTTEIHQLESNLKMEEKDLCPCTNLKEKERMELRKTKTQRIEDHPRTKQHSRSE